MPRLVRTTLIALFASLAAAAFTVEPALAAKKQLAMVVGGLDNPFFAEMAAACAQWTTDHADADYECVATGPEKSSNGADELKLIEDAVAAGASVIGVVPAVEGIPQVLREKAGSIPVVTIDGDFGADDHSLRQSWVTADNYEIGVQLAKLIETFRPDGGVLCREQNNPKATNINNRAAGLLDTLTGTPGATALAGENGWTEAKGCPLYNKDDVGTANKQLGKLLANNPKVNTVVLVGGWAMFDADGFSKTLKKYAKRLASGDLVIVSGDALPMQLDALKAGRVQGLVAQLPFKIGLAAADVMFKIATGETVPEKVIAPLGICTAETADTCTVH